MRATVGILTILGLTVTVAVAPAQAPRNATAPQRRAILLPPVPLPPSEFPRIARASAEDLSGEPAMTPVVRPTNLSATSGPVWLNGASTDPNIRPAGGVGDYRPGSVLQVAGSTRPKDEPSLLSKGYDKLKGAFSSGSKADRNERRPEKLPAGVAAVTPTANTAFRGTTATGAPVYAGPPAYRWYGWGSVTPGANPYAQTGQYPPASANWYSITGATPGAFPVPVSNPLPAGSGTEPPAYVAVPNQRIAPAINTMIPERSVPLSFRSDASMRMPPPPADLASIEPPVEPRVTPTPTITVPPASTPISVPVIPPVVTEAEPPIRPAIALPPLPAQSEVRRLEPVPVLPTTHPEPLPVSVTEETGNWQRKSETTSPGDWSPAGAKPVTKPAVPETKLPNWQPPGMGLRTAGQSIARGQIGDARPDQAVELIRRLCSGRGDRVETSWTGSKKLTVKFVGPTVSDVRRLADEISARPELAGIQIDYQLWVK